MRRIILTLLLLVPLGIGLAGAILPTYRVDKPGMVAFVCLGLALALGGRALWYGVADRGGVLAVALACLLMLPFAVIARGFGRVDMLALLFHTDFGTQGAGLAGLDSEILKATVALGLVGLTLTLLANLWQVGWRLLGPAAFGLLAVNPLAQMLVKSVVMPPPDSNLVAEMRPVVLRDDIADLPDLLLVYLEGTDRRFSDPVAYGTIYDPLRALEPEAITFLNVGQIAGTGWSLAGMVATQCGVPLVPRGLLGRNNFDTVKTFLPKVTCLTDVLAEFGYVMEYVVGGDEGFAGIDAFYRTHGVTEQVGLMAQRVLHPSDEVDSALIGWVLDDQMTFASARLRLPALMQADAPFLQIVETVGPHGKLGYLSRRCAPDGQAAKSRDVALVARCTIDEVAHYIRDLRAAHARARRDRPLRIALMSDHLNHSAEPDDIAPELYRANTVMLIGGPGAGRKVDVPGAMIDVYPTLLEWLGLTAPGSPAGLGRSLLTPDPPPLVAEHGLTRLDAMLVGDAGLGAQLWMGSD